MKAKPSETSVMHHNNGSSLQRIFQAPIRWTWCSWRNLEFLFILDVYNVGKAVKQSIFNPSLTTKKEGPTWSNYGMLWVVYDMAQFHRSSSMSKLSHFFTCDFVAQWLRQGLLKHFIHSGTSWRYHGDPWGSMGIHGDPWGSNDPGKTPGWRLGGFTDGTGVNQRTNGGVSYFQTFPRLSRRGMWTYWWPKHKLGWINKGTGSVGHSKWSTLRFRFGFAWNLLVYHHFPY